MLLLGHIPSERGANDIGKGVIDTVKSVSRIKIIIKKQTMAQLMPYNIRHCGRVKIFLVAVVHGKRTWRVPSGTV